MPEHRAPARRTSPPPRDHGGSSTDPLAGFSPAARGWFSSAFEAPTPAQTGAWPAIARGGHVLVCAPTGSGKTLAAFLWCLDRLVSEPAPENPLSRLRVLYVSPLKALVHDVERNLRAPLAGLRLAAEARGAEPPDIRVAMRTGDTPAEERRAFGRRPPDILVTTPESLYLLLTSAAREALRSVRWVIVDEIHALAPAKRGAHLALSLERLEALTAAPPQRIGLSATQRPLETVAAYLGGRAAPFANPDVAPWTSGTERPATGPDADDRPAAGARANEPRQGSPDAAGWPEDADVVDGMSGRAGSMVEGASREPGPLRPVTIVDAGVRKPLELQVVVPIEDMSRLGEAIPLEESSGGPASGPVERFSIWPAIHPRIVDLIRAHHSTIVFVNSRGLAERLARRINEVAEEDLVRAHHGSLAREQRVLVEEALKEGRLAGIVATSSLELGIDMGAVDLVVQVESPGSVARGMQRIGRAGHRIDEPSRGVIFPKYRGDLLECAVVTRAMHEGAIESTTVPRNPLDVLAQQLVAAATERTWLVDDLYGLVRRAENFATLGRAGFEAVLAMLAGQYPSDEFAELRPRIVWDRVAGTVRARAESRTVAVLSGGTIPDRGLYGVFLDDGDASSGGGGGREAGQAGRTVDAVDRLPRGSDVSGGGRASGRGRDGRRGGRRVGELDEEMVYETRAGEVILLGASAWRITRITADRVLVEPAPGQPGKVPFWKGDGPGRPVELGRELGAFTRHAHEEAATARGRERLLWRLTAEHDLDRMAGENLLAYLDDQAGAGGLPTDRTIVVERFRDELGDWRVCLLTPFGGRVHAPWALAIEARLRDSLGVDVRALWSDDGIVLRIPATEEGGGASLDGDGLPGAAGGSAVETVYRGIFGQPEEIEEAVVAALGSSALFASRFRENAARALLLPRVRAGRRRPLWQMRQRAAQLLEVASRYGSFPIVLETFRECLRDVFDMPALRELLASVERREIEVRHVETSHASPFAASLLFDYVAAYMYEGDAPLVDRRAQALALDRDLLRELLGAEELRELLDRDALAELELDLQALSDDRRATSADRLHDLLRRLGDLSETEVAARVDGPDETARGAKAREWLAALADEHRAVSARIGGETRWIASEDVARYRDALGISAPPGTPVAFLVPVDDALSGLLLRWARTHGPFLSAAPAARWVIPALSVERALERLLGEGRILRGEFRPGGWEREWCDPEVLRALRRRSLARLRREIEPVEQAAYARFLPAWHGIARGGSGAGPGSGAFPAADDSGVFGARGGVGKFSARGGAALGAPGGSGGFATAGRTRGLERLVEVVAQLEGLPLPASVLERDVLPVRVPGYVPRLLDELGAAGEVAWVGHGRLGADDGRIALYRPDRLALLLEDLPGPADAAGPPDAAAPPGAAGPPDAAGPRGAAGTDGARGASSATGGAMDPAHGAGRRSDGTDAAAHAPGARGPGTDGPGDGSGGHGSGADGWIHRALLEHLSAHGASFYRELLAAAQAGARRVAEPPPAERALLDALWDLAWDGLVTNDTFAALRALRWHRAGESRARRGIRGVPPEAAGRWSLVRAAAGPDSPASAAGPTARLHARALALLERQGVVTRDGAAAEPLPGGFAAVYPVLRELEERGRVRRGYFVERLGAAQFALPGVIDRLRAERRDPGTDLDPSRAIVLAAVDPAQPYGGVLAWPRRTGQASPRQLARVAGAYVVLLDGEPAAFLERGARSLHTLPAFDVPGGSEAAVRALGSLAADGRVRSMQIARVDGVAIESSSHRAAFEAAGFRRAYRGWQPPHDRRPGETVLAGARD